ncbi:MAG: ATP-binding protein [Candidatus Pacebacteria bacterium]|nr:ATP-binding protein [Candidatus Paceibacterota bacterium]
MKNDENIYYSRSVVKIIKKLIKSFPVVSITGPRQSGKTTFLKHNYPNYKYYNLEDPVVLDRIKADPKEILGDKNTKIIFDEVQRMPELLSYIQAHVDETQKLGNILISGSQNLLVSDKISQSLAGRAAYQTIYPLSTLELKKNNLYNQNKYTQMFFGGYPGIYSRKVNPNLFFRQYIATYVERDVRNIKNITNLAQFQKFIKLLAGRVGQVLNIASLANDTGISPNTAEEWISILEASYIVFRLQPYYANTNKRLIKSPKVFFYDTGLLCALLDIDSEKELETHFSIGHIFENFIISDCIKLINNRQLAVKLYFFRDKHGNEVDLILDNGSTQVPIEIKLSSTFNDNFLKGLEYWKNNFGNNETKPILIYGGNEEFKLKQNKIISWGNIENIL